MRHNYHEGLMCTALYVETSRGVFNSQIEQRFIYLPAKHTSIKLRRENSACVNQLKMTTLVPLVAFFLRQFARQDYPPIQ